MKLNSIKTTMLCGGLVLFAASFQFSSINQTANAWLKAYNELNDEQKRLPENAVAGLDVAPGLNAQLFVSEPVITNPTNLDVDDRGRVWVCEAFNYRPAITGNETHAKGDRIMILEDTNSDGKADKSTVFYQGPELNSPLGIWVMGNKAIVSQSPYVWVFTDEDGDDKADKKEILFEGMNGEQHDHGMHAFTFGPDGKYYFNFGNAGQQIKDKNGNIIKDQDGEEVSPKKYKQGMVFRCNPDGTNFEVLGHNFRNNYEVAVDSYGTMWQSDNDDDGNKGVRINYVMDYGNYGYTDEMTGAGWEANRTNIEAEIPKRHWHLNDPGAMPNLLQTGAGSPTGMIVYEGSLLPSQFQNQVIHCDAGPNVVRAYPATKDGAGYTASIENVVYGARDQWFRPSDVCTAPDGSLMVADWYDPGVGGHQAGDLNRGRVFRVAPANVPYIIKKYDYTTAEGATLALQNPNLSVRYKAFNALVGMGDKAIPALENLWNYGSNDRMRARALWILAKMKGDKYIQLALKEANPDLRMVGIRAARELNLDVIGVVTKMAKDADAQVRRECALALHHNNSSEAANLWATLAQQHDGKDRWYLEALGVAADRQWDKFFAAWQQQVGQPTNGLANRDIVWRARTEKAIPFLAKLATEPSVPLQDRLRYFRAFDFNSGGSKSPTLLAMMNNNTNEQTAINKLVLNHLDPAFVASSPEAQKALTGLLNTLPNDREYLDFVAKYNLPQEANRLFGFATASSKWDETRDAATQLLKVGGSSLVWAAINGKDEAAGLKAIAALRSVGSQESLDILSKVLTDSKKSKLLRAEATRALGGSWSGEEKVLQYLKEKKITGDYIAAAVQGVGGAWRRNIRVEAASYLGDVKSTSGKKTPSIPALLAMNGDAKNGFSVFQQNCSVCHQVNNEGMNFGPKLTEIGGKLAKEGQYLAILHPDAGISFGYEGYEIKMKDGSTLSGIISSKTETDIDLKYPGGTGQRIKTADVKSMKQMSTSMMPAGLQDNMTTQELADLVEYLGSLKKK